MSTLPTNIVRQGEPSRSAMSVAALRAVHALLDIPIVFSDPLALPVLGAATEAALRNDPFALNDPMSRGLRAALVARSRFVEDELSRFVAAGGRQYLILGAGLDTFAYRNPHGEEGLRVFEVDHPGTQRWKQQRLTAAGIDVPECVRFVALDFEQGDLAHALQQADFGVDQAAFVSWMGVSMYLNAEAAMSTLRTLARFAPGSQVCFDHRVPATMLNPVERAINEVIEQRVAAMGEPWLSAFDPADLQKQLLGMGFRTAASATPDDLNALYFARRHDGLRTGGGVHLVLATT